MAKIASGSNAVVSIPAGNTISVSSGGGQLRFEFPTGTVRYEGDGVDQTFGPYSATGDATITSLFGGIDYVVSTPPPRGSATLLAASAVAASVTGTTNETALATVTIPAGAMGLNGAIEIRTVWMFTNSANTKTLRVRLGGIGGTVFLNVAPTTTASSTDTRRIRNRGSAASQVGSAPASQVPGLIGSSSSFITTGTVDTSAAQDLVISGALALGTETITLESYEVWLLP